MCLSVVIQVAQYLNIRANKPEAQTPIGLHGEDVKASSVASQPMQPSGWLCQVFRPGGHIQGRQQLPQALRMNRLNATHSPIHKKRFKPFMPECEDHKLLSLDLQVGCFELDDVPTLCGRRAYKLGPVDHQLPAFFKQVATPISRLGVVADGMC